MRGSRVWCCRGLAGLGVAVLVLTTVARTTVLNAEFDARAIADAGGYDRMYSEVLPSAPVQQAIRRTLSGLPVDPAYLTDNARLVVPPDVLEQVVRTTLAQYLQIVLGRADRVNLDVVLQPVVTHLIRLIRELSAGLVSGAPQVPADNLQSFDSQVTQVLGQLSAGRLHIRLPTLPLRPRDVPEVSDVLTRGLTPAVARHLRHRLARLLLAGDLGAAFALVLPRYLDQTAVQRLGHRLARQADAAVRAMTDGEDVQDAHQVLPIGIGWLTVIGLLLLGFAVPLLLQRRQSLPREAAAVLGAGALVTLLVALAATRMWHDPLASLAQNVSSDPPLHSLARDIDRQVREGVVRVLAASIAALSLAAALAWLAPVLRRAPHREWQPLVASGATGALGVFAVLAVVVPTTTPPAICNGSPVLCHRPYNRVTYLTTHNAMASTDRGFLAADQDLNLISQLDNGVRGLMLDLHYWRVPSPARPYLADLDASARAAFAPVLRRFQPHPGVWLCHDTCQLGADPAVAQLKQLRSWLTGHPHDVVTLILQDDVSPADVVATIDAAGLRPWLATPPEVGAPWPQLGQLIAVHHTLFVFTQRAALSTGPIRNFYGYAAETPFQASTPSALSCRPGRGPASAPLFLVNNWISDGIPRRADALTVNRPGFLVRRVRWCESQRDLRATFVAVNFSQVGLPLVAVDRLNHLR